MCTKCIWAAEWDGAQLDCESPCFLFFSFSSPRLIHLSPGGTWVRSILVYVGSWDCSCITVYWQLIRCLLLTHLDTNTPSLLACPQTSMNVGITGLDTEALLATADLTRAVRACTVALYKLGNAITGHMALGQFISTCTYAQRFVGQGRWWWSSGWHSHGHDMSRHGVGRWTSIRSSGGCRCPYIMIVVVSSR